jgi:hypothetical protein
MVAELPLVSLELLVLLVPDVELVDPEKVVFIHSGIAHGGPEGLAG